VLVEEQAADRDDAEPVEDADVQPEARGNEQRERREVQGARARERAALSEPRRPRMEPLRAVDVDVEERVEQVEAGDPRCDRGAEGPRLPRQVALDRRPGADRREAVDRAEPEMAEPREPLQVRVDDEGDDGDRRQPPDERVELEHRHRVERERRGAKADHLGGAERTRRELARRGARVERVDPRVDQTVERHRERAGADHRKRDPEQVVRRRHALDGEERADVREREREDRVLELDEPVVEAGDLHVCWCCVGSSRRSDSAWPRAGRSIA
jgi:hypothetical protein